MLGSHQDITSIGSAVVDIFFYTEEGELIANPKDVTKQKLLAFEFGAKIVSDQAYVCLGGGALNTATTFAQLGLKASVFSSIGSDSLADEIIRRMKSLSLGTALMQRQAKLPTAISCIVSSQKRGEHVAFYYPGARTAILVNPKTLRAIKSDWIYLSSLSGSPRCLSSVQQIIMYAARKDIKVAWNPGVDELSAGWPKLKKLFPLVEVLSVNLDEAIQLALSRGEKVQGMNVRVLIKKIHQFGQAITVITQGSKGALVYDGSKLIFKSAPKIKAINSTGAGDAFTSGFVTGLIRFKGNISRALSLGIHNSASVVMHIGAQKGILSAKDIIKLNI